MIILKHFCQFTGMLFLLVLFGIPCATGKSGDFATARRNMVLYQIQHRGIQDPAVLDAMARVPRHTFVLDEYQAKAYTDRPLPIGYGQTISQPYMVALMTQLLGVDKSFRVLEIGTGSGYQAAVLAQLVRAVYTVEILAPLHQRSTRILKELGYQNIHTFAGDGYFGWETQAPFDAIMVTCASDFIPPPLIEQLKPGGVMCIPVGPPFKIQHLVLVKKGETGKLFTQIITSVRFVPLTREPVSQGE